MTHFTDCGPVCKRCDSTIWSYDSSEFCSGYVHAKCIGCRAVDILRIYVAQGSEATATEIRRLHETFRASMEAR